MESYRCDMGSFGLETEEWEEAQMRYVGYREESDNQIELIIGFQGLRGMLIEWEEDKAWQE